MKKSMIHIGEIFVNLAMIPLFFIRFFESIGISTGLNSANELVALKTTCHYNMIENLETWDLLYAVPVELIIIVCSVSLSVLSTVIKDNQKLNMIAHVVFAISIVAFLLLLWFAASPVRNY